MHYIIENVDQLHKIPQEEKCFINIIRDNDDIHTILSNVSLIYYVGSNKGYIIVISHSEGMSIQLEDALSFILNHKKIYCLDSKEHSYYIDVSKLIDLNFIHIQNEGSPFKESFQTKVHSHFYNKFGTNININKIIPISKHYEKWEAIYSNVKKYIGKESNTEFLNEYTSLYKNIEMEGINVDLDAFGDCFELKHSPFSLYNNTIYTHYNLYNSTKRPTNSFNGINFLALNKEDNCRKSFVPKNNIFIEFDFDSYHLRLIANLIGFEFDRSISVHEQLGRMYFNKEEITPEEYEESKKISFQNIYGGIQNKYSNIEFFKKINSYIDLNRKKWMKDKIIDLPTGDTLPITFEPNPLKVFNYIIQNLETKYNVYLITKVYNYLLSKKSKIVLVVYDSFLIDFSLKDTNVVLYYIKDLLWNEGFPIKVKVGSNYDSLKKLDIYI